MSAATLARMDETRAPAPGCTRDGLPGPSAESPDDGLSDLRRIPILIVLGTVSGGYVDWRRGDTRTTVASPPAACSSSGRC